jgi:hypothetical protein
VARDGEADCFIAGDGAAIFVVDDAGCFRVGEAGCFRVGEAALFIKGEAARFMVGDTTRSFCGERGADDNVEGGNVRGGGSDRVCGCDGGVLVRGSDDVGVANFADGEPGDIRGDVTLGDVTRVPVA